MTSDSTDSDSDSSSHSTNDSGTTHISQSRTVQPVLFMFSCIFFSINMYICTDMYHHSVFPPSYDRLWREKTPPSRKSFYMNNKTTASATVDTRADDDEKCPAAALLPC